MMIFLDTCVTNVMTLDKKVSEAELFNLICSFFSCSGWRCHCVVGNGTSVHRACVSHQNEQPAHL